MQKRQRLVLFLLVARFTRNGDTARSTLFKSALSLIRSLRISRVFSENHDSSLMIFSQVPSDSRITYENIIIKYNIRIEITSFVFLLCCPYGITLSLLGLQRVKKL